MAIGYRDQSSIVTAFGLMVAIVAIIGTQVFGWEWGDGQLIPTIIGITVVAIAVLVVVRRVVG